MVRAEINLQSRKHLANQISGSNLDISAAKSLISYVCNTENHSKLWKDNHGRSDEVKGKWVRDASRTKLGILLKLVDSRVLAPQDKFLPKFIFGRRKGMSNVHAVYHLMGYEKQRTLLAVDITRFFESVTIEKVDDFFGKSNCQSRISTTLSKLCCVPRGRKDKPEEIVALARGFPTSTRLAVWSYVDVFCEINSLVMKRLKDYDPRVAVYIDDVGISASRVPKEILWQLADEINDLLISRSDGELMLNKIKTTVTDWKGAIEHMGVKLNRNSIELPHALQKKLGQINYKYLHQKDRTLKLSRRGLMAYQRYVKKISNS